MVSVLIGALIGMVTQLDSPRCDQAGPQPVGFHARGFGYVAELFPPQSRHNTGTRPVAYLYQVEYPGIGWTVQAQRLWTAQLANEVMPQAALVSMAGHVVTLDDYHEAGADRALVVYDPDGRLVRSFTLRDLLGDADLSQIPGLTAVGCGARKRVSSSRARVTRSCMCCLRRVVYSRLCWRPAS